MKISRHFSQDGQSPYAGIDFDARVSEIKNPDGSTVFRQEGIAVPQAWSAVATDILAQKYFRKSGVPQTGPDGAPLLDKDGRPVLGGERDARQVFHRLAGAWTHWGVRTATSIPRPMPGPSTTRSATCSPPRSRRRTRRNGSIRGCTGRTASRARPRAITTSSPTPAS